MEGCCVNLPIKYDLVDRMRDRFQRSVIDEILSPEQINGKPRFILVRTTDEKWVFLDEENKCTIYEEQLFVLQNF